MRADNRGEGGSFALLSLIARNLGDKKWTAPLVMLGVLATCLFYGDAMITPAISVLSAVEGLTVVEAALAAARHPDLDRHSDRAVPRPVARHRQGRRHLRAGDPRLSGRARRARRDQHHGPSGNRRSAQPHLGGQVLPLQSQAGVPRARLGVPGGDRRGNALCRHGPFRPQGDRLFVADPGLSVPDAQLSGPGRASARRSGGRRRIPST